MTIVIGNGNDGRDNSAGYLCYCYYTSYAWNSGMVHMAHVRKKNRLPCSFGFTNFDQKE